MEQSMTVIQEDLAARSKKALTSGILSMVIPSAVIFLGYILFIILFFALGFGADFINDSETVLPLLVVSIGEFLLSLLIAGIVMTILGKSAWNQAKAIRQDAISAGVRRPAKSIVAHAFGISSFASGLFVIVLSALYLGIFALVSIGVGLFALR